MKKRRSWILAAVTAAVIVALSCIHQPVHPTKSEREWASDHKACEVWARETIREEPDTHDDLDEMKMIKTCMKAKGWRRQTIDLLWFLKSDSE